MRRKVEVLIAVILIFIIIMPIYALPKNSAIDKLPEIVIKETPKDTQVNNTPENQDLIKNMTFVAYTREEIKQIIKDEFNAHRKYFEIIYMTNSDRKGYFADLRNDNETEDTEMFKNIVNEVLSEDHYLRGITKWKFENGPVRVTFYCGYTETFAQRAEVKARVKQILALITNGKMDNLTKEKAINDWIVKNISYDTLGEKKTAYEALKSPYKTNCYGLSMLTYEMLKQAGIANKIILGKVKTAYGSDSHAWNLVQIGKNWFHLDVTWNLDKKSSRKYFNLTDKQISVDHSWKSQ